MTPEEEEDYRQYRIELMDAKIRLLEDLAEARGKGQDP
jgi:hypothetical protein